MKRNTPCPARQRQVKRLFFAVTVSVSFAAAVQADDAFSVDSTWMSGDWGGQRNVWLKQGIDIKIGYTGESATQLHGGYHEHEHATRYADQFNVGADLDLQKMFGWKDAAFSLGRLCSTSWPESIQALAPADAGYFPEQHSHYVTELNYGIQATRWLNVMPNLQYVKDPDGVREIKNALVFGLQVQSQF